MFDRLKRMSSYISSYTGEARDILKRKEREMEHAQLWRKLADEFSDSVFDWQTSADETFDKFDMARISSKMLKK